MALIKCSECGSKVSNKATACPKCGAPVEQQTDQPAKKVKKKGRLGTLLLILFFLFFVQSYFGDKEAVAPAKKATSVKQAPVQEHVSEAPKTTKAPEVGVKADRFDVKADLVGSQLNLSVATDLPEFTKVSVTVNRLYKEKGNPSDYGVDYFSEKSTIGQWRAPRSIQLDNAQWNSDLSNKQREMSRIGMGFDVASISDKIRVRMVVPIGQENPKFGKRNEHLTGAAVRTAGVRVVEGEVSIKYPLYGKITQATSVSLDPQNLTIGQVYIVSRATPLMPSPNPSDPMAALEKAKKISAGGGFKVMDVKAQNGKPWYLVALVDTTTDQVVTGWINSIALLGQNLDTP